MILDGDLMDREMLKIVGEIAGIGGLALGVFLILYRNLIRSLFEKIPILDKRQAFQLLKMILILVWSITLVGMFLWAYVSSSSRERKGDAAIPPSAEGAENKNGRPKVEITDTLIDKNSSTKGNSGAKDPARKP